MLYNAFARLKRVHGTVGVVSFLLVVISNHGLAQQGALPCGLRYSTYHTIPSNNLPALNTGWLARQSRQYINETIAYNFKTRFVPDADGDWKGILPGVDSWFLKLRSAGAFGIGLVLSDVRLLPGETLYIYNQQDFRGVFTNQNIPPSGVLPISFLQGDEIVIEYDVPSGKRHGTFRIETVSHAFQNIFEHAQAPAARTQTDCYRCLKGDVMDTQRRSVVKLIIQYDSISKFCTGVLMNNSAGDNKPYVLTAQHCVSNQFDADRSIAVFGFEDIDCEGETHFDDFLLTGAYHRASLFENDFALLEFYTKPPLEFRPYYAGWDISDKNLDGVTCVHHPQGGPKKISLSNAAVVTGTFNDVSTRTPDAFWNVIRWDIGVTEGGSSGAPLFTKNNHVMGSLSGGSSECGAPYNDYFEKLSASWEVSPDPTRQLKHWLDPVGSGISSVDGADPFAGIDVTCDVVSNVKPGELESLMDYTPGDGFYSGVNSAGIASYAEKFTAADSVLLTRVTLNVGSITTSSAGGVLISINRSDNGLPGLSLADFFIPYNRLAQGAGNNIEISPYVKLAGDFFISYTISYSPGDAFALLQANWRTTGDNTAFVKLPSGWAPITVISPNSAGSAFGIKATFCEKRIAAPPTGESSISFFPNPAAGVVIARFSASVSGDVQLLLYDVQGKRQNIQYHVYENNLVVTTADLIPGIYIIKLATGKGVHTWKFVKY